MKRLCYILIAMLLICFYSYNFKESVKHEDFVTCARGDGSVSQIEIEEYVKGVVAGEMPLSFELEALKAQAVVARTFVYSRNLKVSDDTSSQVYLDEAMRLERWGEQYEYYENKLNQVINDTKSQVLLHNNQYISALYFSSSNGKTENNEDYFEGSPVSYLRSVSSNYEEPLIEYEIVAYDTLVQQFGSSDLQILNYTQGGRVNEIKIGDTIYTGREIREQLHLNSTSFAIKYVDEGVSFTTYGFGHGVGMSQYGAQGMAKAGKTYQEILSHYYQGVTISKVEN